MLRRSTALPPVFHIKNLPRDPSTYSLLGSIANHRRFKLSATNPVVLLPANGSRTKFLGVVRNLMKNSARPAGIRAGWIASFLARQKSWYDSLDRVLLKVSTFGGIAPL